MRSYHQQGAIVYEELDEECRPFQLPSEKVLQFIENNHGWIIERHAYANKNYYNTKHKKGKHHPAFSANSGEGVHVLIVEINSLKYVVGMCKVGDKLVGPDPIPFHNSGRNSER